MVLDIPAYYSWTFEEDMLQREQSGRSPSTELLRPQSGLRIGCFGLLSKATAK
ncbi:hypothetical protein M413DRAFT_440619 [Hebeloma cylindrosporum]|uniref:Uncharacterized protein n=1 Tax=Hebeloma cylindrosporum TaxID=76867 RepID=A0A0C2YBB2_HEBCY|nr:hypothetical protein M413DRAFT_440619 [Hebeloma cylindrosporum h7]